MKAVVCTKYGTPDVLKVKDIETPDIKEDEVLIKIEAAAVTVSDTVIRKLQAPGNPRPIKKRLLRSLMRLALGINGPRKSVLGMVSTGKIVLVGSKVTKFKMGDEVLSFSGSKFGGYAEYKTASELDTDKGELILKPQNMSFEETAAIAYGGMLAIHFLKPQEINSGDRVLIYGASGAIGTMAIQLAKAQNAEVTAVCSKKNTEFIRNMGVDKVLDYTDDAAVNELSEYDLVFDAVGYKKTSVVKDQLTQTVVESGKYVSVDDAMLKQKPEYLEMLKDYAEKGQVKAVIDRTYTLDTIVEAHTYVEQGHKRGNVILKI